ncbi:MAG TPA: sigma 54-interacting transcriptional regulator [Kofleriaceae bacterium]|nr:sigma 54-interacting transcriptional regulator [Kofleriaceae bacterium]
MGESRSPDATATVTPESPETMESGGPGTLRLVIAGDGVYSTESLPATGKITVGRADDNDITVDDGSISRHHAQIFIERPLRVEDLGSANGTWVREVRLAPNSPQVISVNEAIRVGTVTLIVQGRPAKIRTRRLRDHGYFEDRVEDECARATRAGGNFVIVHIVLHRTDLDLQPTFAAALRESDVVATYSPGELEILLVDSTPDQAANAVSRLEQELSTHSVPARIGTAWFPRDGRDASTLMSRARERASGTASRIEANEIVVTDEQMTALYQLIERIAATDISVLLLGETGVGKEVVAETLHRRSARATKPFLRLNCGALTETLLESELFGHERGSFTGATQTKPGLFEVAEGGVLFLDEVGELLPSTQVKLLRVLDERKVMRVGGIKPRDIDVRVIAATNRDLDAEVDRGTFRVDLLYRLNAMSIVIPPLRERVAEIVPLARTFLRTFAAKLGRATPALSTDATALLMSYSWPGNIRELRNVIERAVVLCHNDVVEAHDLPEDKMRTTFTTDIRTAPIPVVRVDEPASDGERDERQRILMALEQCAGNQTTAAKLLGISRRTLINKMEKFAVPRPRKRT